MVDRSLSGYRFAHELDAVIKTRGRSATIVSGNRTELTSMAMLEIGNQCRLTIQPTRQTAKVRLHQVVQRALTRRVPERDGLLDRSSRSLPHHRSFAGRIQWQLAHTAGSTDSRQTSFQFSPPRTIIRSGSTSEQVAIWERVTYRATTKSMRRQRSAVHTSRTPFLRDRLSV